MTKDHDQIIEQKLETVIELLRHLLALELSKSGVTQTDIGKHLHVAKSAVVRMLRGVNKE